MNPLPADLREPIERASGTLGPFGRRVLWYPEIGSTNDVASTLAERGEPEGTVIVADAQTAGRGRLGRTWASPGGAGLYLSIILRPDPSFAGLVTLAAGVAVAEGIERATGLPVVLKWPNDVYVEGRKLAGILAEAVSSFAVVLGIGINVLPAAYPQDVAARATSLETELGRAVDRGAVLAECLVAFALRYDDLRSTRSADVVRAWKARAAATFGRRVAWESSGVQLEGIAQGVDGDGALLVQTPQGMLRIISGEVRWI